MRKGVTARKPKKPRNPVAKVLRALRPKRVPDKRRKMKERSRDHDAQ